jgi:hypothetical protein
MIHLHAFAAALVLGRHVFHLDAARMAIALELPGDLVLLGLYYDGELVWMTDRVTGEA